MAKSSQGWFKRFLNFLFNIFWFIFGGLMLSIFCIIAGILSFLMILPIFFGIPFAYFKMIPLCFAPAGKKVVLHFGKAPVRNVFAIILGLDFWIGLFVYGAILCCTVIFIPIGLQVFKYGKYAMMPFGVEIAQI